MARKRLVTLPLREKDREKHRYWLIAGIDTNHDKAHNVMGYIKVGDSWNKDEDGITRPVYEWWFDLDELDVLGIFLLLSSRFWAKTQPKSKKIKGDVEKFVDFWKLVSAQWPEIKKFAPRAEEEEE